MTPMLSAPGTDLPGGQWLPGTQNPHDPKTISNPLMVLLSSRLTGPSPASSQRHGLLTAGGESVNSQQQSLLAAPLVSLKREWQVIGLAQHPTAQCSSLHLSLMTKEEVTDLSEAGV